MSVRLVVDSTRCDGHGICALLAPGLVSLDPWGYAHVSSDAVAGRRALRTARRAAAACPARALLVVEAADGAALRS